MYTEFGYDLSSRTLLLCGQAVPTRTPVQGSNPKPAKKTIEINDNIISKQEAEWIGPVMNDQTGDQPKARKRHKNKPSKDKESTITISKHVWSETENGTSSKSDISQTDSSSTLTKQTGDKTASSKSEQSVIKSLNQSQNVLDVQAGTGDKPRISIGAKNSNTSNKPEKLATASTAKSNKQKDVGCDGSESREECENWSQNQQVILEWALKQYPKGTEQRWEKIAKDIPGKSKEDCIARFKLLAEIVKQKKQQSS